MSENNLYQEAKNLYKKKGIRALLSGSLNYLADVIEEEDLTKYKAYCTKHYNYKESPKYLTIGGGEFVEPYW